MMGTEILINLNELRYPKISLIEQAAFQKFPDVNFA